MSLYLNSLLVLFLLGLAILAIRTRRLFTSVVILGAFGFVLALVWANLGAVDVSFTEAVVGAGISTVFVLAALRRVGEREVEPGASRFQAGGGVALLCLGLVLLMAKSETRTVDGHEVPRLPAIGAKDSPAARNVSPYYIEHAEEDAHTPNIVTAVLADYRGYDTMLETGVVFTAAMASILILGVGCGQGNGPPPAARDEESSS